MPSEDSKSVKKEEPSDDKLLSSISHKKNSANGRKIAADYSAKPRAKQAKVKKEETHDDEDFKKPGRGGAGSLSKGTKVKKEERLKEEEEEEEEEEEDEDDKPISKRSSAAIADEKVPKKKKKKVEGKKATAEKDGKEKKEKKVYELPGQKRDPPEERDPLRIFYETLYKQVPHSEMAQFWMMESGLLAMDEAKKVFEKKQKKKLVSPIKSVSAVKSTTKSITVKKTVASSPVSLTKKKMVETKVASKQLKKRRAGDEDSDGSDEDFLVTKISKKQKVK